jgi:methyl-accepting chemotaxis protein
LPGVEGALPSGAQFYWGVVSLHSWMSIPALAIVIGCLAALLRLTSEQWTSFTLLVLVYAALVIPITLRVQRLIMSPIVRWLDGCQQAEEVGAERTREAFAAMMALPLRAGALGALSWVAPVVLISIGMPLLHRSWGWRESLVMLVAGLAAGFMVGSLVGYRIKERSAQVREALCREISDPAERAGLIRVVPLRAKLLATISFVTLVPVIFAVLLAQSRTNSALEEFTVRWHQELLDSLPAVGDASSASLERRLAEVPLPIAVQIASLSSLERVGELDAEVVEHIRALALAGTDRGDSAALPGGQVFAWRATPDGEVTVAVSPGAMLRGDATRTLLVFGLLILVSAVLAFAIAYHAAHDVSRATDVLRGEAERLASGDLRPGRIWESEDELGQLARSFAAMGDSLRRTVSRVAEAAQRVESAAGDLSPVSEGVASVTAAQVAAMESAASSMEEIDAQVRGIAASSGALNESVEESSSSVLELGAAGEELNETAVRLHEGVEGVSTSIEQTVRSVRQVLENTESLSSAAEETSASMEEMASSLREVDVSAQETSRLSAQVVERAESGQAKVSQTIDGMEAIQQATETAEQVIRRLHGRTVEIGAIVDVIDDVADETNLLALNAAIIAAQSGEQGRAFSVVADEIKDLAERVLASTKEIGGLISAVQEGASKATRAIEEGTTSVAKGVERSAEAGMALEEITRASRQSGHRMQTIVVAVQAQAKASGHVVLLMEKVRAGVEQIREASVEQDRGHALVSQSSVTIREVAHQVRTTTEEQARGSSRIRESIEEVRQAVEQINGAIQEQSQACASALEGLWGVQTRTHANDQASHTMNDVTKALLRHAGTLKSEVERFRT